MKIRKLFVSMCVIGLILGLTACGAKSESKSDFDYAESSKAEAPEVAEEDGFTDNAGGLPIADKSSTANADLVKTSQKLIKNIDLYLETLKYDELISFLDQKIKDLNGYVEESQSYGNSIANSNLRNANLTVRVPSDRLDEFVNLIGENTAIIEKRESTQDVTSEYVDTESRKKALEIQQERLFALLEKADKMEDIITLESRISEVTYQLESYTSTLRTYDNLVDYSTVTIRISEVERVTNPKPEGTWEQMKNGLSDSFYNIKEGFKSFSVWFVSNLPYLIIWAVIIVIAVILSKKAWKVYNEKYNYNINNYNSPSSNSRSYSNSNSNSNSSSNSSSYSNSNSSSNSSNNSSSNSNNTSNDKLGENNSSESNQNKN